MNNRREAQTAKARKRQSKEWEGCNIDWAYRDTLTHRPITLEEHWPRTPNGSRIMAMSDAEVDALLEADDG